MDQPRRRPSSAIRHPLPSKGPVSSSTRTPVSTPPSNERPAKKPSDKSIEIRLIVPDLKQHSLVRKITDILSASSRRQRIIVGIGIILLIGIVTAINDLSSRDSVAIRASETAKNPLDQLKKGTPNYPTVLPAGKSIDELGGWTRVSPDGAEPVYAYVDTINGIPVSVSEQPLPDSFKADPDTSVRNLALGNNATKIIKAGNATAYIGSTTKGPQSVFVRRGDLLLLMKSNTSLGDDDWKQYIQALR